MRRLPRRIPLGHFSRGYLVRLLVRRRSVRRPWMPRFSVPGHLMSMAAHVQMAIVVMMAEQRQSEMKRAYLKCKCRCRHRCEGCKCKCRSCKIGGQFWHGPAPKKERTSLMRIATGRSQAYAAHALCAKSALPRKADMNRRNFKRPLCAKNGLLDCTK